MGRACIALVDDTRARFFTVEHITVEADIGEELVEHADLVNLARRRRPSELVCHARPGSLRTGHLQYAFDDHRDYQVSQLDAEFARTAMAALSELLDEHTTRRAIVCAGPHMLRELRASARGILPDDVKLEELPWDLVSLPAGSVRAQLARHGFLR